MIVAAIVAPGAEAQTPTQAIQSAPWYTRSVGAGVTARSYQFDSLFGGPQAVYVLEADMNVSGSVARLPFLPTGSKATVQAFAGGVAGAAAAVNGNFFTVATGGSIQFLRVDGTLVNSTSAGTADEGGLAVNASGVPRTRRRPGAGWASLADPNVMATNIVLIEGGVLNTFGSDSFNTTPNPRTAVGATAANRFLMVIVDGRSATAAGMTIPNLATTMLALGAVNAVNMDGGGSSTMWDRDMPGNGVSNIPSDGAQRPVANGIAVVAGPTTAAVALYDARRAPTAANASPHAPLTVSAVAGQTRSIAMSFVNRGTATWTPGDVGLATAEGRLRASGLFLPADWTSPSRPTPLDTAAVAPGQTGTFTFQVTAPSTAVTTTIVESFALATSASLFFGPEQNRLYLTVVPPATSGETVVESRQPTGALTASPAYAESAAFFDTTSKSSANPPPVSAPGSRYSATVGRTATFRPDLPQAGLYDVYVTMGAGSNNNANATYAIVHDGPTINGSVNMTASDTSLVNGWKLLQANVAFQAGTGGSITFTNVDGSNASGLRFVMDAVRFRQVPAAGVGPDEWPLY